MYKLQYQAQAKRANKFFKISCIAGIYTLTCKQELPATLPQVWRFFSKPENLDKLSPKDISFSIVTPQLPDNIYQGQIITYQIGIFPLIKNTWVTEITLVKEQEIFVDEQRYGPYRMWHHEHHFSSLENDKILMLDRVTYQLPFGWLGRLLAGKMVRKKLQKIFSYRYAYCQEFFSKAS